MNSQYKILEYLNEFCKNDHIFFKIKNELKNYSSFSPEKIEYYTKFFIKSLIDFFKNNFDENIFTTNSFKFFKKIEIQEVNFQNIIKGFSLFSLEFITKYYEHLSKNELINFLMGINRFLENLNTTYNKKLKSFYEKILNSISSGILILDKDLTILKANKKFFEISGIYEDQILHKKLQEVLKDRNGIDIPKLKDECNIYGKLKEKELIIKRKNGRKYHRTINADILIDENGMKEGYVVYVKDTDYLNYLKDTFSKYLSKQVAQKILDGKDINLKGERKEVAIMFVDIRNFTEFSEKNKPEYVLKILNNYFNLIIDIVFEFEGTLDKFIGDAVMVIFGAPIDYENKVTRCVDCAIKIQKCVKNISNENEKFELGIGINFGEVVVGNIGAENKRLEYTAIGDTVNTADRVQKITPGGKIYITQEVAEKLNNNSYNLKFIKKAKFKGKSSPVNIFEVIYY